MGILDDIIRQAEDEYRRENDPGYEAWKAMQRALHSDEPSTPTDNSGWNDYLRNASMDRDQYGYDLDNDYKLGSEPSAWSDNEE